ncbi:MAG: cupin domain-containing protein [Dermatophilaceae bacterium]
MPTTTTTRAVSAAAVIAALTATAALATCRPGPGRAGTAGATTSSTASPPPSSSTDNEMVVTPYDVSSAEFAPLNPDQPGGPQVSVLWGNTQTGPSAALFRFPKGYGGKFHTHTADYHLALIDGTMKHWGERQSEAAVRPLGRGSYWFQPGGQVHSDQCLTEYCIAFVKFEGPIDVTYVD